MNYQSTINLILLVSILSFSCAEKKTDEEAALENNNLQNTEMTAVDTALVKKATFYYYISANGKFEAARDQKMLAETGGRVKELHINEGQRVKQGDLLLQLDDEEAQLNLQKAELALASSKINYENELLGSPGLTSRDDKLSVEIKDRMKISGGVNQAELELASARLQLKKHQVRAAYDGIVSDIKVSEQEYITAGKELFNLFENGFMLLRAKVLENDAHRIEEGMPVLVKTASSDQDLSASISFINPRVDENGMFEISIKVKGDNLMPGMSAFAEIKVPKHQTLMVPKDAVVIRSGRPVVFTIEKGIAKWNYVKTGLDNGREVEILEGLEAGQLIITSNNLQLAHDAPVAVTQN